MTEQLEKKRINRVIVNAWFCKCHCYNKMKTIPVPMPSGSIFKARVRCYSCGEVQQQEVMVDYWGDKRGQTIQTDEGQEQQTKRGKRQ